MAEKRKPQEDLVKLAGRAMTHPEELTGSDIKRMAARILDDQKNDPEAGEKPSIAAKVISAVGDLLPGASSSKDDSKTKTTKAKAVKGKAAPEASPPAEDAKPATESKPASATSTSAKSAKPPTAAKAAPAAAEAAGPKDDAPKPATRKSKTPKK